MLIVPVLLALPLVLQDPQQPPLPTFKSAVDVVAVDVSVIDSQGRPITGLTATDFSLTVDGRPRRISSLQFISVAHPADKKSPALAQYTSNDAAVGGRLIALVVDQGNISTGTGKRAIDAARRFVRGLNPADRVALFTLPGAGPRVDFTSNHALVESLLDRVVGTAAMNVGPHSIGVAEALAVERNAPRAVELLIDRECAGYRTPDEVAPCRAQLAGEARALAAEIRSRTTDSLLGLRDLFERLSIVPSPKTVVLISEGLIIERELADVTWVAPLAARSQLSLYVLQVEPPIHQASTARSSATRLADIDIAQDGLAYLSGLARGSVFRIAAGADFAFARIATELSAYYLVSFEPEPSDRDGKTHKIRVSVPARRDATIRARSEFAVDATRQQTVGAALADTIRSPLLATDMGVTLATYSFWDAESQKIRLVLASEIDRSLNPSKTVSLAYVLLDDRGAIVATDVEPALKTPIGPGSRQIHVGAAVVPDGVYTIKLAVIDEDGKRGSVEHTFRAQLESAGQVRIGGLLLAERAADNLPLRPGAGGRFSSDTLFAYLELYSPVPEQLRDASVVVEIAATVESRALESAVAVFHDDDGPGRGRAAEAILPLTFLKPGDYVARAIVSVAGRKVGQIVRPFRVNEREIK